MARKKRGTPPEEHADETWLVPYSDILTLLLALFIVLFASSQIDQKKLAEMSASFGIAFGGSSPVLQNSQSTPKIEDELVPPQKPSQAINPQVLNEKDQAAFESVQLSEVKKQLDNYIAQNQMNGVETVLTEQGLIVRIKDSALFHSGKADLVPESQQFARETAKMLAVLSQRVIISGHTDDVPINTPEFPSNWDLSSKRALNFMKFLLEQDSSLDPGRFSATGYSEYRPIADNATPEGQAKNRRVEVLILRNYR